LTMATILIIDDDQSIHKMLTKLIRKMGYEPLQAMTLKAGIEILERDRVDVVILDVHLPDGNGIEALSDIRKTAALPEVIINTGFGDLDGAELAIENGAWDYFVKPESIPKMTLVLKRVLEFRREKLNSLRPRLLKRDDIIGGSTPLNQVLERIAFATAGDTNVLISGETGTGKELFARAIHENSSRSGRPFVVVDCTSLPAPLLESILFGHEKGAFTGADKEHSGVIKQADGGTLFLDEIGELDMTAQKKFLRVIQERKYRPISSEHEQRVDFRLISATNRELGQMVKDGTFRRDLLYRVSSFPIETPPLRDRPEDIETLTAFHMNRLCERYQKAVKEFSPDFLLALKAYSWPGNVRELFNTLEEVLSVTTDEPILFSFHLPTRMRASLVRDSVKNTLAADADPDIFLSLSELTAGNFLLYKTYRTRMEHLYLARLMQLSSGNKIEACRLSGLSRTRLFELLKKHHIGK
jgi:two-component system NtrC family response regulator